jgi:phosphoserine phosphatase RsbX
MDPAKSPVEWGVAQRALPGESVCGDTHVVLPHGDSVLLAVIDGVGHGPEAAQASELAAAILRSAPDQGVQLHFQRCHVSLAHSRGAVMTLADFNAHRQTLTLCGVGNVEAMLYRFAAKAGVPLEERALLRGGVVGGHLPEPYASVLPVYSGDVLVMMSDGLRSDLTREQALRLAPQRLADWLLEKNSKGTDDALVLVVRFRDHENG